jgi:hypothetical protein
MLAYYFDYRTACLGLILTDRLIPKKRHGAGMFASHQHAPPPDLPLCRSLLDGASSATRTLLFSDGICGVVMSMNQLEGSP